MCLPERRHYALSQIHGHGGVGLTNQAEAALPFGAVPPSDLALLRSEGADTTEDGVGLLLAARYDGNVDPFTQSFHSDYTRDGSNECFNPCSVRQIHCQ